MKVLIIKLSALGDIVHAIPTANALQAQHPEAKIDWLCYKNFAPILHGQSCLNQIIEAPDRKLSTLYKLAKDLRHENYDLVIDMQGLIKTALIARFISPYTRGFKEPREGLASIFYKEKIDAGNVMGNELHIVERNLKLSGNKDINIDYGSLKHKAHCQNKVCLIPSTTWSSKLWPPERWAQLIDQLKAQEPQTQIYLLGTLKDLLVIEEIVCQTKSLSEIVVDKELQDLPEFFSEMKLVIGVDTGPLHIAAATLYGSQAQILGLYGPSSGARTGPYGFSHISVDEFTNHIACNKRQGDNSMSKIQVENLINLISQKPVSKV